MFVLSHVNSPPIQKMITDAVYLISSAWEKVRFLTTVMLCYKNIIIVNQITNDWMLNMFW